MNEELVEESPYAEPEPKPKTKLEQFIEKLSQYSDAETAKLHIGDIAKELGCAKSLGYKALKKIETFQPKEPQAIEPTVKIPEAKPEEIPEEPEYIEEEAPIEEAAPTPTAEGESEVVIKLTPILQRSLERIFNNGLEIATGVTETLDTQEVKDTATLLPFIIYRVTKQKLTEDNFIDMTSITHFGSIVIKVVNQRMKHRKEKPVEPPKTEGEKPKEPEKQTEQTPLEPPKKELTVQEKPTTAPFMQKL